MNWIEHVTIVGPDETDKGGIFITARCPFYTWRGDQTAYDFDRNKQCPNFR